ncbi:cyclin-like protein [Hyaloraphidium curvatum]|nr:cyclin-like protein [Hyaloraphidium curvatum]
MVTSLCIPSLNKRPIVSARSSSSMILVRKTRLIGRGSFFAIVVIATLLGTEMAAPPPMEFLLVCAETLKIPRTTTATALAYFHRYKLYYSDRQTPDIASSFPPLDDYLVATAALDLACKTAETVRKIRDVINVGWFVLHPEDPYLPISDQYHALRDSLVNAELIMLRVLRFELQVDLPHRWIARTVHEIWCRETEPYSDSRRGREEYGHRPFTDRDRAEGFAPERDAPHGGSRDNAGHGGPYWTPYSNRNRSASPRRSSTQEAMLFRFDVLRQVAQFAWAACADAMMDSELAVRCHPRNVAAACVYLGIRSIAGAEYLLHGPDRQPQPRSRSRDRHDRADSDRSADAAFQEFCRHVAFAKSVDGAESCVRRLLGLLSA